jgi:hypothetical protein
VYAHYGAFCSCCGETEPLFLTIDHVNDDAPEDRRAGKHGGTMRYLWIIKQGFPDCYRILCLNCNRGRWLNGGVCPHLGPRKRIIPRMAEIA